MAFEFQSYLFDYSFSKLTSFVLYNDLYNVEKSCFFLRQKANLYLFIYQCVLITYRFSASYKPQGRYKDVLCISEPYQIEEL